MTSIAQKSRFTLFAVAFSLIAVVTVAQSPPPADVNPAKLTVLENEQAEVLCTYGVPLAYCRIVVPGVDLSLILSEQRKEGRVQGFTYHGTSLSQGQCGVHIRHVSASNHGLIKCFLGTEEGEEAFGQAMLTVALPPRNPELVISSGNRHGTFVLGETIQLKCTSPNGRPAAKLSWLLDNEPLTENLGREETSDSLDSNNQTLYTATQTLTRQIRAGDDHKTVTCRATHAGQSQEAHVQLRVKYQPQPQPQIRVFGVVQGLTALVNVSVNANPRPHFEWTIDGEVITESAQSGRYEAYEAVDLGNGVYNATLAIAGLTLQDTLKEYVLKASNELGVQEYSVRISSSEAAAVSGGLDIGSIVGIAVGAAVLVLIVALVVVARLTGKWCFADSSSGSNIPVARGAETSDTESADDKEQKKANRKKFALNFPGLFTRSKDQQQQHATDDVEDARTITEADDGNDDAARSEATVIIEDDPPKLVEKNLVYAELMLKPAPSSNEPQSSDAAAIDTTAAGDKEATEYAEIAYVAPTAGGAGKAQQPKRL